MDRFENLNANIRGLMANEHVSYRIPDSLREKQRMMRALMNVWEPCEMPAEWFTMQDAELQQQAEDKGSVAVEGRGMQLWQGDITRLKVLPLMS